MTAGFGVDKGADGSGTNSSDIRKISGGLYTPGIISGCDIVLDPTVMKYTVKPGVIAIRTAADEIILAPVAETSVIVANGPEIGTRNDIVYVQQRYPSIEGDANIVVGVGSTVPPRALRLRSFTVPAGASKSNLAVANDSVDYSIPYGANGAALHFWTDTSNGAAITGGTSGGVGTFYLPTDRKILISLNACLSSNGTVGGWDNSSFTVARYAPYLDGARVCTWLTPGLTINKSTYQFEQYVNVSAGEHTIYLGFDREVGPGFPVRHYSGADKWPGTNFVVRDAGVIV
jgi:hypothetical protein